MGLYIPQDITLDQALLIDAERGIAFFEQRVQAIENGRVAKIGILEYGPLAFYNRSNEYGVNPFEPGGAPSSQYVLDLVKLRMKMLMDIPQVGDAV